MKEWIQEEHREQKMYAGADGEAIPEEFREARNKGLYYLQFSGKTEKFKFGETVLHTKKEIQNQFF